MPKFICFSRKSITINIRLLAERRRLCSRSSERKKNEYVTEKMSHVQLCIFAAVSNCFLTSCITARDTSHNESGICGFPQLPPPLAPRKILRSCLKFGHNHILPNSSFLIIPSFPQYVLIYSLSTYRHEIIYTSPFVLALHTVDVRYTP
jgi:hypothetical protein